MAHQTAQVVRLPDGQNFTVKPVLAGVLFKSQEHSAHRHSFTVGWTVVLETTDAQANSGSGPWTKPSLQNDALFISSVSNLSETDSKPAVNALHRVALMLWTTLYWYFHHPAPSTILVDSLSAKNTPEAENPRGEWTVRIKREGVLRDTTTMAKLERMGLMASLDSSVGTDNEDANWANMFLSRRGLWQLSVRFFDFAPQPALARTQSRAAFPSLLKPARLGSAVSGTSNAPPSPEARSASGPFVSHMPTYFPPPPLQYVMTDNIRHPLRQKPPRPGEFFYTRFIPSINQYLSFRAASLSETPVPHHGPVSNAPPPSPPAPKSDTALLRDWFSNPRIQAFWGQWASDFLSSGLANRHSFPVIGCWDGVPFGYFEIYWAKEDILGRTAGCNAVDDFDRGIHVIVGESWARGRVQQWLSSLVHWCFTADNRTMRVCIEPRVDNASFIQHLEAGGFAKQGFVNFPHKQSWFGTLRRDNWDGPVL